MKQYQRTPKDKICFGCLWKDRVYDPLALKEDHSDLEANDAGCIDLMCDKCGRYFCELCWDYCDVIDTDNDPMYGKIDEEDMYHIDAEYGCEFCNRAFKCVQQKSMEKEYFI